jgi:hypothetical protein
MGGEMIAEDKMPTIRRDVLALAQYLERARKALDLQHHAEAWGNIDLAIARIQGMSFFIGPWEKEVLDTWIDESAGS